MQIVVLALLKKATPFFAVFIIAFGAGCYLGDHMGAASLAAARLALSVQQADDAKTAAAANAVAVADLAKASSDANAAEASVEAAISQSSVEDATLANQITVQAVQPGQDAPDAPVLSQALNALKGIE